MEAKRQPDEATAEQDPTPGMTPATVDNHREESSSRTQGAEAQKVIDNGDATVEEIRDEKSKVEEALTALNQAKDDLRADKTEYNINFQN